MSPVPPQPPGHGTPRRGPMGGLVILGAGYTGRYLYQAARGRTDRVWVTSRSPEDRLTWAPEACRLTFDLGRPQTWPSLPPEAPLIWCFPAAPPDLVRRFAQAALAAPRRLVVLGSTSAYDVPRARPRDGGAPALDEEAPVRSDLPRVQGEDYLRRWHGAIVLRVAGIYGPGRHVLEWIRRGRVAASPRMVNLIHVEDLAAVCLLALQHGAPGEVYNVSDGTPRRWADICREAAARWGVRAKPAEDDQGPGKRILTGKLIRQLGYACRHPDLYEALAQIEAGAGTAPQSRRDDPA